MAEDYPDGTLPVGITANYIGNLPVNVAAWAVGTLNIDIVAQTVGNLNVNIINATIAVTGTVAVSGTVTVTGAVTVTGTVAISGSVAVTGTVAISGSVTITGAVTITSGNITVSGAVTITSGSVTFTNTTIAVTGTVAFSNTSIEVENVGGTVLVVTGNVVVTGTVSITGTVTVTGTVVVSGTVAISGTVTITGAVTVTGSVTVSGTVAISGSVTVTGTVAISGTVTVTGAVTITGSVTITSGTVNIQTAAGTNIVLDILTQGAYTERRSNPSNQGAIASWTYQTGVGRDGKFFPRGCRGFLSVITVYCKDVGVSGGTITVYVAPQVGMAPVASVNVTVPAGGAELGRNATFNIMWNYDSMFISVKSSSTDIAYAYDNGAPYDYYSSGTSGATWVPGNFRLWIIPNLTGETCGDVPVSGTVNNIEIPCSTTSGVGVGVTVPTNTETSIASVVGAGKVARIHLYTNHHYMAFYFYVDGVKLSIYSFLGNVGFAPISLYDGGFTASTPKIQLLRYNAGVTHDIGMDIPFEFRRSFEIKAYHEAGSDKIAAASIIANLIG